MITKKQFELIIGHIKKQFETDRKCSDAFKVILPHDYVSLYDNDNYFKAIMILFDAIFEDHDKLIDYFMFELEFGAKYKEGMVKDEYGEPIKLGTASDLYDFVAKKIIGKEQELMDIKDEFKQQLPDRCVHGWDKRCYCMETNKCKMCID